MNNSEIFDKDNYKFNDIHGDEYISIDYQNISNFAEYVILTTFTIWVFVMYFSLMTTISTKMKKYSKNISNIDYLNEQIDYNEDNSSNSKLTNKYVLKNEFKKQMKKMKKRIKKIKKELKGYKQINIESDIIYMDDDMNSIHSNE